MSSLSRSQYVLRNIGAQALSRAVTMVLSFALLPFVISHVGKQDYGLYLLVLAVTGYFTLLDFGVSSAVVKYVAEYRGRGDHHYQRRILSTAFAFYVLVGILVGLALLALSFFADRLLHLSPASALLSQRLLITAGSFSLILWPTTAFRGAVEGFQRYDVIAVVTVIAQSLRFISVIVALTLGAGVLAVLVCLYIATLAENLTFYRFIRKWDRTCRVNLSACDLETFRLILGFSVYLFAGSVTSLIIFQLDHVIVGAFVSVSAVTMFGIAHNLHAAIKSLDNLIAAPPWAASAELEGRRDYIGQRRLLLRGTRYIALFFLPLVVITVVFAPPLIRHWMGPGFEGSVRPAQILLCSWIFISLWETGNGILTTKGLLRVPLLLSVIHGLLHLVFSLVLVRLLGITGTALATTIPVALMWPPTIAYVLRKLDLTFPEFARQSLTDALIPLVTALGLASAAVFFWYPSTLAWTVLEMGALYCLVFVTAYVCALDSQDRHLIRRMPRLCFAMVTGRG